MPNFQKGIKIMSTSYYIQHQKQYASYCKAETDWDFLKEKLYKQIKEYGEKVKLDPVILAELCEEIDFKLKYFPLNESNCIQRLGFVGTSREFHFDKIQIGHFTLSTFSTLDKFLKMHHEYAISNEYGNILSYKEFLENINKD